MKEWFGFVLSNKRLLNFGFSFNWIMLALTVLVSVVFFISFKIKT